jgi:predicted RNA-binding Zn-ribbon protein involved in translation (DUF1610 family)
MSAELECGGCGKRLKVRPEWEGKKAKCPACGAVSVVRAAEPAREAAVRPADFPGPGSPPPPGNVLTVEPVDALPLQPAPDAGQGRAPAPAAGGDDACPECGQPMARDAVICLDCGFNRKTGKQLKTVSRRVERTWYLGGVFEPAVIVVFVLLILVLGAVAFFGHELLAAAEMNDGGPPEANTAADLGRIIVEAVLVVAGVVLGALLLLGTFTRIRITRDRGGKPLLFRDRWMFFIPVARSTLQLDEYQLIRLGHKEGGAQIHLLAMLLLLFLCGLLPGLIFYMLLFRGSTFTLEVAGEHEGGLAPEVEPEVLYRGPSEAKMRAIGDSLKEIAGLRYG